MKWISTVKYQDPLTTSYLGSPSIVRMDNGDLLASHDYFGPGIMGGEKLQYCLTSIYRSKDNGESWQNLTHIIGAFWSTLFKQGRDIYLLGTSSQFGDIVIRRSEDYGCTWTYPRDSKTGVLFQHGRDNKAPKYHCAPTPVLEYEGKIYKAFENNVQRLGDRDFDALVISCDAEADLLDGSNWTMSNQLAYDKSIDPPEWGQKEEGNFVVWLEGNIVEAPEGGLVNILRVSSEPVTDYAAFVQIHDQGKRISFDPNDGFRTFPGGTHKFTIRKDPVTNLYWILSNKNTMEGYPSQRNVLSLHFSEDLINWNYACNLLEDDQGLSKEESVAKTGFQYVDWQFDDQDIIYLARTSYKGAHNFHDSNYIIFNRIKNFRLYA